MFLPVVHTTRESCVLLAVAVLTRELSVAPKFTYKPAAAKGDDYL